MRRDLRTGLENPNTLAKIEPELDRRSAGFREGFGALHSTHADIQLAEVVPAYLGFSIHYCSGAEIQRALGAVQHHRLPLTIKIICVSPYSAPGTCCQIQLPCLLD